MTGGIPDAAAFETIGSGTPATGTGTHQLGVDVTRIGAPAPTRPTGSRGGHTTGGTPRQFTMLTPGEALGDRYHIIRLLGVGGMGAVYHAWDSELGVAVALKVIRGDITGDPDATAAIERQFKRELLLARQVTHKHVVRIHDLGDIDGLKYITMPYVQGADLASILKEAGTLPIGRTLRYITQIVGGLVAAHEAGVVHRDLKPANIMIDQDDQALIMDFGIAHSSGSASHAPDKVVGTLAYMAPEQAQAKPTDQRADVYALGMMLREMLVGRKPTSDGQQALADLMTRIKDAPPRLRTIDETIPEPLDAVAARCVEPDPANRFQSSAELAAALAALDEHGLPIPEPRRVTPRLIASGVASIVVLLAGTWWLARTPPPPARHPAVTVLLADLDNRTGESVLDGALEPALATALEGASFVNAYKIGAAHAVASQLRPGFTTMDEALARLVAVREGVKVVIASAVTRDTGGYRLTARAIDAKSGNEMAKREMRVSNREGILPAIGKLTAPIRKALGDSTPQSAQVAAAENFTAGSLEAAHEYSLGHELQQINPQQALQHYLKAVELDPKLGRAYDGLAVTSITLKKRDDAERYYRSALSLLDHMSEREKLRTLANYYGAFVHNYDKAIENFEQLVSLYPGDDVANNNLSVAYGFKLQFAKAAVAIKRARDLNPGSIKYQFNYVTYLLYSGDFATAITEGQRIIRDHPEYQKTYLPLALALLARGDTAGARDVYAKLDKISPSVADMGRADLEMYFGRDKSALTILQDGIAVDERDRNEGEMALKYVAKAEAHVALGQKLQSLQAARKAARLSSDESVQFPAARALIAAGDEAGADTIAAALDKTLQTQSRSYAQLIRAEIALAHARYADAIDAARAAQKLHDSWVSHFLLGRAYLEAGHFAEALASFDTCTKRVGETADLMFVNSATLRYLPPLYFWTARAQAGVGTTAAAMDNFRKFVALRTDSDASDPLIAAARRALSR